MLKKLLHQLFDELENERDNDKKTKNGNAIYFVERILEERFGKPNYIAARTIKSYYEKYVEGKENRSGEPSSELKDLMAQYLGFENFLGFENENKLNRGAKWIVIVGILIIVLSGLYYNGMFTKERCLVWNENHYEKVDCEGKLPNPLLKNINIDKFEKVQVTADSTFFVNGHPVIFYGRSKEGSLEYFNSAGVHPVTFKYLKPITRYMIETHIKKKDSLNSSQ